MQFNRLSNGDRAWHMMRPAGLSSIFTKPALHASKERFQEELKKFMADHMRRKALIQRLVKAGIWKE
jgi:hypothetical protein